MPCRERLIEALTETLKELQMSNTRLTAALAANTDLTSKVTTLVNTLEAQQEEGSLTAAEADAVASEVEANNATLQALVPAA